MTTAEKKQRNREYYLKNRERILNQAKARKSQKRQTHLEIVSPLKIENAVAVPSTKVISDADENFQPAKRACLFEVAEQNAISETFEGNIAGDRFQANVLMVSASSQFG